jgi:hypothetical protein
MIATIGITIAIMPPPKKLLLSPLEGNDIGLLAGELETGVVADPEVNVEGDLLLEVVVILRNGTLIILAGDEVS